MKTWRWWWWGVWWMLLPYRLVFFCHTHRSAPYRIIASIDWDIHVPTCVLKLTPPLCCPWILMAWCFSTSASVATVLNTYPYVSCCLWVKLYMIIYINHKTSLNERISIFYCFRDCKGITNTLNWVIIPQSWEKLLFYTERKIHTHFH